MVASPVHIPINRAQMYPFLHIPSNASYFLSIDNNLSNWCDVMSHWASLLAQLVKNIPTIQETGVQFLGWEDPLEKRMATHSSILASRIPWTEEPGGL